MAAAVTNRQRRVPVSVPRIRRAAQRALTAVGRPGATIDVDIVDDREIARLNTEHRGIRRRTDVLAFPLELADAPSPLIGQVVVSADTARRQSRRLGVALALELDLLVTHGVLHVIGYDDRDPMEATLMHRREREILTTARFPPPARLWAGLLHASR